MVILGSKSCKIKDLEKPEDKSRKLSSLKAYFTSYNKNIYCQVALSDIWNFIVLMYVRPKGFFLQCFLPIMTKRYIHREMSKSYKISKIA